MKFLAGFKQRFFCVVLGTNLAILVAILVGRFITGVLKEALSRWRVSRVMMLFLTIFPSTLLLLLLTVCHHPSAKADHETQPSPSPSPSPPPSPSGVDRNISQSIRLESLNYPGYFLCGSDLSQFTLTETCGTRSAFYILSSLSSDEPINRVRDL